MRLFITGGTGFIGSHFINAAYIAGHELICLKRKESSPRIKLLKEPYWVNGQLDEDIDPVIFKGVDVLVHLAAHSANVPYDTLENCLYWNVTASLKLLNIALNAGIGRVLIAGSCFEYGRSGERYDFIPPDAPLEPTMTYPASKAAAFCTFYAWAVINKVRLKYLRIFQVYGEGEAENRLWPSINRAAENGEDLLMTEGEQIRDFIHVSEVTKRFLEELSFTDVSPGDPFIDNVGTGNPTTLRDFAEKGWKKLHAKGKIKFGEIPYRDNEIMRFVPLILKIQNGYGK